MLTQSDRSSVWCSRLHKVPSFARLRLIPGANLSINMFRLAHLVIPTPGKEREAVLRKILPPTSWDAITRGSLVEIFGAITRGDIPAVEVSCAASPHLTCSVRSSLSMAHPATIATSGPAASISQG